ncbi:MAG: ATP-binding protein [Candidatus Thorarchaeota archaeon]
MNYKHVIMQICIAIAISFIWCILSLESWSTYQTHVAMYILLSFLAIMCSAGIAVQRKVMNDEYHNVLHNAMIYTALVFLADALYILFYPMGVIDTKSISWHLDDLYFLATFSVLVLLGVLVRRANWSPRRVGFFVLSSIIGACALHALFFFTVVIQASSEVMIIVGIALGLLTGICLPIAGFLWTKLPHEFIDFDRPQMIIGFTVFGISWMPMVLSLILEGDYWTLAFPLRAIGFFFLLLAVTIPFLKQIGMISSRAYQLVISIALLGFVPVIITTASEVISPGLQIESIIAYQMAHLGASVLLIVIAFLVIAYSREKPAWNRYPIIFLYTAWSVIEMYILISSTRTISLVPYVIGSLLTLLTLPLAIRWTLQEPKRLEKRTMDFLLVMGPFTTVILLTIGNFLENIILTYYQYLAEFPIARGMLMAINLLVLFAYTYLAILLVNRVEGRIGVDMVAIGALLLWIVPVMLKGNYAAFSIGWWASEMFLVGGLLGGPTILGILYVRELSRAEHAQRQATLFADLLVHDISNYHQAITVCLGLLESKDLPETSHKLLIDATSELERADNLIRNVRRLGLAEQVRKEALERIDVVECVRKSIEIISRNPSANAFEFDMQYDSEPCFTSANILLVDAFNNIILNAVRYSNSSKIVEVKISEAVVGGKEYYQVEFIDYGQGISPTQKEKLFVRYMEGAYGTGLGLAVVKALIHAYNGRIEVHDRVDGDYSKGTRVVVFLPAIV